jgi:hypothetical protein
LLLGLLPACATTSLPSLPCPRDRYQVVIDLQLRQQVAGAPKIVFKDPAKYFLHFDSSSYDKRCNWECRGSVNMNDEKAGVIQCPWKVDCEWSPVSIDKLEVTANVTKYHAFSDEKNYGYPSCPVPSTAYTPTAVTIEPFGTAP